MMLMMRNRDVVFRRQRRFREHAKRRYERHEAERQLQEAGRMDRIEQLARANSVSVRSVQGMRVSEVRVERVPITFHETVQKARPRPVTPGQEEAAQVQRHGGEQRDRDFQVILHICRM